MDVQYPTACELYLDGVYKESFMRPRGPSESMVIETSIVSDSSSAPLLFSAIIVTGEKKAFHVRCLHTY